MCGILACGFARAAPRHVTLAGFLDAGGEATDAGIALYFPCPASFTGEDVLELHGHGEPVVMDLLAARTIEFGARPARAGEFTERAFHNEKLDLAQAEAIADLIDAGSAQAALVVQLRVFVEAAIDFPDKDIELLACEEVRARLADIREHFRRIGRASRDRGGAGRRGFGADRRRAAGLA